MTVSEFLRGLRILLTYLFPQSSPVVPSPPLQSNITTPLPAYSLRQTRNTFLERQRLSVSLLMQQNIMNQYPSIFQLTFWVILIDLEEGLGMARLWSISPESGVP